MGSKRISSRILLTSVLIVVFTAIFAAVGFVTMDVGVLRVVCIVAAACVAMGVLNYRLAVSLEADVKDMIDKVVASAGLIERGANQLSESSESLATGSSQQAAALEQTSAMMNEVAPMIAQNAENTRVAADIVGMAMAVADRGVKQMQDMIKAMNEIQESSDRVGKIVKAIDNIASQTNLLAINATVEAARAGGDAGRSFNVVAEEVRSLALKSAKEAADTTSIIERNIELTGSGREMSNEVANTLGDLMEKAQQLSQLMAEVNISSEQGAVSTQQIKTAIDQVEKVTQDNAALAQENAASANSMKDGLVILEQSVIQASAVLRDSGGAASKRVAAKPAPRKDALPERPRSAAKKDAPPSEPKPAPQKGAPPERPKPAAEPRPAAQSEAEKIIPLDDGDGF